jgi:uncharacterized membrane protein
VARYVTAEMKRHPLSPTIVIALALVGAFLATNVVASGFERLGIPRPLVGVFLVSCLAGSLVNIPVWSRTITVEPGSFGLSGPFLFYHPPVVESQIVAVNLGGAIIPSLLSAWLLFHTPIVATIIATTFIAGFTHGIARIRPGIGIAMPALIPPVVAALFSWGLTWNGHPGDAPAVAYISGSLGTLIGADLLNLRKLSVFGHGILSIGGAGIFDGVFLVGAVAAILA